jgi:Icc-related predicted phosphoesterase
MKIVFISDTHSKHQKLGKLSGETIVHCGDFSSRGLKDDISDFLHWFSRLDFKNKILIAGNHDFGFENENKEWAQGLAKELGLIYLNDSAIEFDGVKFWGSPVQPEFCDWAFNRKRGEEIAKHWKLIPNDTDILITHGPPYGILDMCTHGERVGCEDLLEVVTKLGPRVHAFGHIHEDYGLKEVNGTQFINACNLDERYELRNTPVEIDI